MKHLGGSAWGCFLFVVAVGVPFAGNAYYTTFAFTILIAFVLAQSWDWMAGEMGYLNLGYYCFYAIGAYAFAIALVARYSVGLSMFFALVTAMTAAALLARPLFRLKGDYFAFGTLALLPLGQVLALNMSPITNGSEGIVLPPENVLTKAYFIALIICVVAVWTTSWLNRIRFGYALKSIRNDEEVAEVMGVRIFPVKLSVIVLAAAFAGIIGGIQAWQMSFIDPSTVFDLNVALVPVAMALLGGSGLRWGPLVGVLIIASVQQWLLVNINSYQATIYGAIILIIGRFMPGGLLRAGWIREQTLLKGLTQEHHERITVRQATDHAPGELPIAIRQIDRKRPLLECCDVSMAFGGNLAVNHVNLRIMQGEIIGLIGANGSGKTTLFDCISKVYEPTGGEILFEGDTLAGLRRDQIAQLGVGRTYQIPRPFGDLTVQENVAIPLMFGKDQLDPKAALEEASKFVAYAGLGRRLTDRADALSLQEKKALEFGRAMACKPNLLLVDEVASGLTPTEIRSFVGHIRRVRDRYGITVIWVEHIFSALSQVVDRVIVLEQGMVIADGTLPEVVKHERVLQMYLGRTAQTKPVSRA